MHAWGLVSQRVLAVPAWYHQCISPSGTESGAFSAAALASSLRLHSACARPGSCHESASIYQSVTARLRERLRERAVLGSYLR